MSFQPRTLGHFATYRLGPEFWALGSADRQARAADLIERLAGVGERVEFYLAGGIEAGRDLLVWSSQRVEEAAAPRAFFLELNRAQSGIRDIATMESVLWGMTRPSEYSRAKSAQEIDPFGDTRTSYLVAYPFAKTADWYLFGRDTRQGMMNEHIRLGKQYTEITQLLLYSFGLQDHEFVVVYETEDLALFSDLVYELRSTEARRYTLLDTPIHTAVRIAPGEWLEELR